MRWTSSAKKKQAEALRAEIKQYIQFRLWPVGLARTPSASEAQVRKIVRKLLYRKAEIKQAIIEWTLGILVVVSGLVSRRGHLLTRQKAGEMVMAHTILDNWKVLPRLMMLAVTVLTYQAVHWFMSLDDPSVAQSGLVSVCMGALTGCFGIWMGKESKTSVTSTGSSSKVEYEVGQ